MTKRTSETPEDVTKLSRREFMKTGSALLGASGMSDVTDAAGLSSPVDFKGAYIGPDEDKSGLGAKGWLYFADDTGARYKHTGSGWELLDLEAKSISVERELSLPTYDDLSNADTMGASPIARATGNGPDAEGIYHWDGSQWIQGNGNDLVSAAGSPAKANDLLDTSGSSINLKADFLDDSRKTPILFPSGSAGTSWASAGAPTICRDGETWYIALRQRRDSDRGYRWDLYSNTGDLDNRHDWTTEWTLQTSNVANQTIETIEGVQLRKIDGTFYFYFCWTAGGWDTGTIAYVSASTINGIKTQLSDASNWTSIVSNAKDPKIIELNGSYYMLFSRTDVYPDRIKLLRSDTDHTFSSHTVIQDFTTLYETAGYDPDNPNPGTITYDTTTGRFVSWIKQKAPASTIYWWFAVSEGNDLSRWSFYDRMTADTLGSGSFGDARYAEYWQTASDSEVLIMEWDDDDDDAHQTWLWDYRAGRDLPMDISWESDLLGWVQTAEGLGRIGTSTAQAYDGSQSLEMYDGSTSDYYLGALTKDAGTSAWTASTHIYSAPTADNIKSHGQFLVLGFDSQADPVVAGVNNPGSTDSPEIAIQDFGIGTDDPVNTLASSSLASNWTKNKWYRLDATRLGDGTVNIALVDPSNGSTFGSATLSHTKTLDTRTGVASNIGSGQTGSFYFDRFHVD